MKRKKECYLILLLPLLIYSCGNLKITNLKGLVWYSDTFNIIATSEQLRNQIYKDFDECNEEEYFSSITVLGTQYSCSLRFSNAELWSDLRNPNNNELVYFYNNDPDYIEQYIFIGWYLLEKASDEKDYKYSATIHLSQQGQYYNYCVDNNLDFPLTITLFGYEA